MKSNRYLKLGLWVCYLGSPTAGRSNTVALKWSSLPRGCSYASSVQPVVGLSRTQRVKYTRHQRSRESSGTLSDSYARLAFTAAGIGSVRSTPKGHERVAGTTTTAVCAYLVRSGMPVLGQPNCSAPAFFSSHAPTGRITTVPTYGRHYCVRNICRSRVSVFGSGAVWLINLILQPRTFAPCMPLLDEIILCCHGVQTALSGSVIPATAERVSSALWYCSWSQSDPQSSGYTAAACTQHYMAAGSF